MKTLCVLLATGVMATSVLACARDASYPGSDLAPDESAAINRIALTRLAHEQSCRSGAARGDGSDIEGRMAALRTSTVAEIKPGWCKSNIHPRDLDSCVSQIKSWPCDVELRNVTLIEPCKVEPLCGVPAQGTL